MEAATSNQAREKMSFQTSKNNQQTTYYSFLKFQNYLLTGVQYNIWKLRDQWIAVMV
jgi:hypothetical protein